jgi:hypothetical protein
MAELCGTRVAQVQEHELWLKEHGSTGRVSQEATEVRRTFEMRDMFLVRALRGVWGPWGYSIELGSGQWCDVLYGCATCA